MSDKTHRESFEADRGGTLEQQREAARKEKRISLEEFNPNVCPECKSVSVSDLYECFEEAYIIANKCRDCGYWWTARYALESVRVRKTPYPDEGVGYSLYTRGEQII